MPLLGTRGGLSVFNYGLTARSGGGPVFGYLVGGQNSAGRISKISKYSTVTDTETNIASLSAATDDQAGMANAEVAGYSAGGNSGGILASTVKHLFATDTNSFTTALDTTHAAPTGFSNNGIAGYVVGGFSNVIGHNGRSNKYSFPSDSRSLIGDMTTRYAAGNGFSNHGTAGYRAGGTIDPSIFFDIQKLTYSNDTWATLSATASVSTASATASNYPTAGYRFGGTNSYGGTNWSSNIDKLSFASDTRTTLSAALSTTRYVSYGFGSVGVAGYVAGGYNSGVSAQVSIVQKLAFTTETISTTTSLNEARAGLGSFSTQAA